MKEFHAAVRSSAVRLTASLAAVGALSVMAASPAFAQQPPSPPMSIGPMGPPGASGVGAARNRPSSVARYEDAASQRSFVVDRSGDKTLMRVEDSPEVLALRSTTAQRGDAFLRSDTGQLMLRVTEQGNVISYLWDKDGAPADMAGAAAPLNLAPISATLNERRKETAETLRRFTGADVTIFGTGEFAGYEAWTADVLTVLELGVVRASEMSADSVRKVKAVRLARASTPIVSLEDGELVLGVNPQAGFAGRPSSDAVAIVIASER